MRRKKHHKPMMDQCRIWITKGMVGLTWEPVMSMDMMERIATLRMRMRRKMHCKPVMHQQRIWRTEGIVLEGVKIK